MADVASFKDANAIARIVELALRVITRDGRPWSVAGNVALYPSFSDRTLAYASAWLLSSFSLGATLHFRGRRFVPP